VQIIAERSFDAETLRRRVKREKTSLNSVLSVPLRLCVERFALDFFDAETLRTLINGLSAPQRLCVENSAPSSISVFMGIPRVSMLDLRLGAELSFETLAALLLQIDILDTILQREGPAGLLVLAALLVLSVYSWTVIFAKFGALRGARKTNARFVRAFRKAANLEAVVVASEQFRPSPLVSVFDFGYEEVERQVKSRGAITNRPAVERALQLGVSEELTRLEHRMNVLATVASVSPFVGLLGTVMGIIRAFDALSTQGTTSLRAVGPGIAEALYATALGLFAAIPAAIAYNAFGGRIREIGTRMDDFALEFLNMAERSFGE
jgi:biopolymer transport protein TolQ